MATFTIKLKGRNRVRVFHHLSRQAAERLTNHWLSLGCKYGHDVVSTRLREAA